MTALGVGETGAVYSGRGSRIRRTSPERENYKPLFFLSQGGAIWNMPSVDTHFHPRYIARPF